MRKIKYIVVHATATQTSHVPEVYPARWHYVVTRCGEIIALTDEKLAIPGTLSKSPEAIHIAYSGGIDKHGNHTDNRNSGQNEALFDKLVELQERYPQAHIVGADMWSGQAGNPGFDVIEWVRSYVPDLEPLNPAA